MTADPPGVAGTDFYFLEKIFSLFETVPICPHRRYFPFGQHRRAVASRKFFWSEGQLDQVFYHKIAALFMFLGEVGAIVLDSLFCDG